MIKPIFTAALLSVAMNAHALVNADVVEPAGSMYARTTRAISTTYSYTITNTSPTTQTYYLHAELCPLHYNCKAVDRDIPVDSGKTVSDNFLIQMDVAYMYAGQVPVNAWLSIRGETNFYINKNGFINVTA